MAEPSLDAWSAFHVPKSSHLPGEYEDAYAANPAAGRFAIADGASESSFAGLWARLLAEGYVHQRRAGKDRQAWLNELRQRWAAEVDGSVLPWYAEMKRSEGAFATFLGLRFRRASRTWKASAVGDSCVIQVRRHEILQAFPLSQSKEFDNDPPLLGSRPGTVWQPKRCRGRWQTGDCFLLMTDALAQWFFTRQEAGEEPVRQLRDLTRNGSAPDHFADWAREERARGNLRDDDVTLLWVVV